MPSRMDQTQTAVTAVEALTIASTAAEDTREQARRIREIEWSLRAMPSAATIAGLGHRIEAVSDRVQAIEARWVSARQWAKYAALVAAALGIRLASLPSEKWGEVIAEAIRLLLHGGSG